MIYEFMATQDLHGWEKPWAPGTGINKLYIDRPLYTGAGFIPSGVAALPTDQYLNGYAYSGYYTPQNGLTNVIISDTEVGGIVTSGWYGLGFPMEVDPETDYYISATSRSGVIGVTWYDSDNLLISSITSSVDRAVTSPENAAYAVISCVNNPIGSTMNFKGIMLELGSTGHTFEPYANVCMPEGFNIWDPSQQEFIQVYAGYVNANTRELYLRPVYEEYAGEELVGPWMSSIDPYEEDTTPSDGAFVIDFGGELESFEITPFMLQTLLDSLGIRQHFTNGAGLLNSLMDQAQGRVRSEEELLHLSRPLKVIAIGDQLPAGITFKPISKDVLPGLPGKFIR